ncbi:hypothetical protein MKX03_035689 [Papaver bracteatum]|nr:hypothetical protein MKX03_035689 [Papaver bracteatum]
MSFGISSLTVPSVHEMVKEKISKIPDRYIRTGSTCNLNHENHDCHSSAKYMMPVINIECLLSGDSTLADTELQKLDSACKDWGFFQVVNHGISSSLIEKLKSEIHNLFELPLEEKKEVVAETRRSIGIWEPVCGFR